MSQFGRWWKRPAGDRLTISADARVAVEPEGAVFIHTRSGVVFTSNRLGARIWRGLEESESVETVARRISGETEVSYTQVCKDTTEFVADLERHGFVRRRV